MDAKRKQKALHELRNGRSIYAVVSVCSLVGYILVDRDDGEKLHSGVRHMGEVK